MFKNSCLKIPIILPNIIDIKSGDHQNIIIIFSIEFYLLARSYVNKKNVTYPLFPRYILVFIFFPIWFGHKVKTVFLYAYFWLKTIYELNRYKTRINVHINNKEAKTSVWKSLRLRMCSFNIQNNTRIRRRVLCFKRNFWITDICKTDITHAQTTHLTLLRMNEKW